MPTVAIITAGGRGNRMGQDLPKQFLPIEDKPAIAYTMESLQKSPLVDAIIVVCIAGWETVVQAYANQFGITKLVGICEGGATNHESIENGTRLAAQKFPPDTLVLVHDAARPNLPQFVIEDSVRVATQYGNSVPVIPTAEVLLESEDGSTSAHVIERSTAKRTQTPQGFILSDLQQMQAEVDQRGIQPKAPCEMVVLCGKTMHLSRGSEKNIKLTTLEDIDIFRALLHAQRSPWLKQSSTNSQE